MNCSNCGTEISAGRGFCPKCGAMVKLSGLRNDQNKAASGNFKTASENKKTAAVDFKRLLLMLAGVLVVVILVIGIVAAVTHGKGKDTNEKSSKNDTTQSEHSPKQIAMNTVDEMFEMIYSETFWRGNTYELERWIADHYPKDIADVIESKLSETFDNLYALEDMDNEMLDEILEEFKHISFKVVSAKKLSEDDAMDLRYDAMDEFDIDIPEAEWAYRVTVKMSVKFEDFEYESEAYMDVLCIDGKAGVYRSEYADE